MAADPMVEEAAGRAFGDLAAKWHAGAMRREELVRRIEALGFGAALPSWPDAAAILRAQARSAAPVDMALLLVTRDPAAAIAYDPECYDGGGAAPRLQAPAAAALALGRLLQVTGALEAALELSLGYVQERRQFGRPLAKFQAIQHQLAVAAEEIAACTVAADLALACAASEGVGSARAARLLDCATLVANRAVDVAYDACHQVHGAMGFTREYALHRHSLDLLRWRDELLALRGGELAAAERLGGAALEAGGAWRTVTALMTPEREKGS